MTGFLKRNFSFLILSLSIALPQPAAAAEKRKPVECTVILDAGTGDTIIRKGTCDQRFTPMSSFKVPLALMGYDAGILRDEHTPRWDYKPEFKAEKRARKAVDPTIWEEDSIVWFSQELTRKLGPQKFADYVAKFDYGNKDVTGLKNGDDPLTHAWLMSSLKISPDEQANFIRRILARDLPVGEKAFAMTEKILPVFEAGDGWTAHGKTGSGWIRNAKGEVDRQRPIGWFVGWAEKDGRRVVFARMRIGTRKPSEAPGLALRAVFLKELPDLAGAK